MKREHEAFVRPGIPAVGLVSRLLAACLLAGALSAAPATAGGGAGEDPWEIGEKLFARKNYRTALTYYQKALRQGNVSAHYRVGLIHEEAGRDNDALSHYRLFLAHAPAEDGRRGDAMQRMGAIEERLKREISRSADLLERGKSLFKSGKFREAEKALRQAAATEGSKAEAHFYLGEVYLALEEYDKAKAEYRKAKESY